MPPPPQYQPPPARHGWAKFGSILATLNPRADEIVNKRPIEEAKAKFQNELESYKAQSTAAEQQAQVKNLESEAASRGTPKMVPGDEGVRTLPDKTRERLYEYPNGQTQWVPEGSAPPPGPTGANAAPAAPAKGELPIVPSGGQPIYGKPTKEQQPASANDVAGLQALISGSPYLSKDQKATLQFPPGITPTNEELKNRTDAIKDLETSARQGNQDEFNNQLRKLASETSALLAQAHLQQLAEESKRKETQDVMTADSGYAGLYAQEEYHDKAKAWHQSGHYAKDSGIVSSIVNQAQGEGGLPSIGGGATLGALLGGVPGAVAGAAAPALAQMVMPMAQGYLDAAKRAGISPQGYEAMQAYFNALPARMSYEMQIQGINASVMRSREMISKVLNTVPPPTTPSDQFDKSFSQYYQPMKSLTERKTQLIAPKGYQPPPKENFYPKQQAAAEGGTTMMLAPDGKTRKPVPNDQVEHYKQQGATVVVETK